MTSSDDEDELFPHSVTNYYFEDEDSAPISFSVLPIWLVGKEKPNAPEKGIFLRGAGDVNQIVYKEVIAYRLGLEDATPDIMVLTKDMNKWIKLLRPRKVYEASFRSIMIAIHLLHYLRRNPESSEKSLWDHMRKVFSSFEQFPSVNDLLNHYPLIKLLVESDNELAKSRLLLSLLEDKPRMKTFLEDHKNDLESKKSFIVGDQEDDMGSDIGDESDNEIDLYDSVCAICDNGGEILCCEGRCMRSFHATKEDGEDSDCISLGYSKAQVKAIQHFVCKNCEYKRHQCFICGKLGSSDKSASAEVFACVNATCGHFYHPKCVSNLLFPGDLKQAADCENKIASGESFTCPAHKCHVCKQGEDKENKDLQFAVCRRCPRSYHRKCLPRKIAFEDDEEFTTRAWEDLLPSRILIYCLKHAIDDDLGTPIRNHIVFPRMEMKNKVVDDQKDKSKVLIKKTKPISNDKRSTYQMVSTQKESFSNSKEKGTPAVKCSESSIAKQTLNFQKQLKPTKIKADPKSVIFDTLESKKFRKGKSMDNAASESGGKVIVTSYPKIDSEGVKRITALMESTSTSITLADIIKKRKMPSTHRGTSRNLDKIITWGKLEGSVEAVKIALAKLENGGSVEDAKAVCEPNVISLILSWHSKLRIYLAPFIHAMRYTSFGRHFTKVDKLGEIVDKLQWYVQNDDMIVDFCCGANDFSRLMKEKLDSVGKKCSYKNYDIIQPKFDFNYEKRDWMTVRPDELPSGSRLIMGLNPPFGVRAGLANQFIDKALTFNPKLIILIVPSETERLDQKRSPYDLIWEDSENLAGKSFYLPGSVDVNDTQMDQWNNKPPPLYLWSRPDWTTKHKTIALKQGHISELKDKLTYEDKSQPKDMDEDLDHTSEKCGDKEIVKQDNVQNVAAESKMRSHSFRHKVMETKTKDDKKMIAEESEKGSLSAENCKSDKNKNTERTTNVMDEKSKIASGSKKQSRSPDHLTSDKGERKKIILKDQYSKFASGSKKGSRSQDHPTSVEKSKIASGSKKRSRSPDHLSSDKGERKKIILNDQYSKFASESKSPPENRTHGSSSEMQKAKRKGMESPSREKQREIAANTKEDKDSDMSISQEETGGTNCQINSESYATPRASEPSHTFDRDTIRRNTFDSLRVDGSFQTISGRPNNQNPFVEENIHARQYATSRISPTSDAIYSNTYGRTDIDREYPIQNSEERFYSGYGNINRSSNYNVSDYGRRMGNNDTHAPMHRLSSSSMVVSSVTDKYAPRLDEMNHPRSAGNFGLPGMHGSMRENPDPYLYGSVPAAHNVRPNPYGFGRGADNVRPGPYGFGPGTDNLQPDPYGLAPATDNAGPNSYNFGPGSQHGYQRHNGGSGWIG